MNKVRVFRVNVTGDARGEWEKRNGVNYYIKSITFARQIDDHKSRCDLLYGTVWYGTVAELWC